MCSRWARTIASGHLDLRQAHALLGAQAEVDLLRQRHVERVALERGSIVAGRGVERDERGLVTARSGARERGGSQRGVAGGRLVEPAHAGEPPGAVDENADADALALGVAQVVDLEVLRDHVLAPEPDRARVGVGGAAPNAASTAASASAFTARTLTLATLAARAGGGIGRRARLRA